MAVKMLELTQDTIWRKFEETVGRFPDKKALIYLGESLTYSQLKEVAERFAASLHKLGMRKGDRAILYLPNIPQLLIAWLAMQRLSCVAIPISPIYTHIDLKYMTNDSGSGTIFCMDTNFGYVTQVLPETCAKRVIVTTLVEFLPWWKRVLGKGFSRVPEGKYKVREEEGNYSFKDLLKNAPSLSILPPYDTEGEDMAQMLYTGGTTGLPKGVPYTNIVFLESITEQRSMNLPEISLGEDRLVQGGPLFHILGQAMGLGALLNGDTLILLPRVNLDGIFNHIELYKATTFFGVPTMYRMILEHDRLDYYDLSSLEYCFCAGDVLPVQVEERWRRKFGRPIYQGYGTTETCGRVSLTPINETPPMGSAGKITPLQKIKLVDPDTLEPVPPGEAGELLVSSDHMVTSYWNKPEETSECFVNLDGRSWYKTKDIVRVDENGWLFYIDRSVDTIKHKGYRVSASEIETTLQAHPAVIASCVVGIPDERVGERIKAFVVLKEDVKGVSAYDLIRWCRERLAPYKVPGYIEFRDMLPKSKVGKLLRREMRAEERKKL
jgi:long-chain acyl-CoA synthetase